MLKVIIADDEAHVCRLIQALVDWEAMGLEVVGVASNGIEAIELVDSLHPNILITDIRMPGCDGIELIKKVKTANPKIEVIIISGHAHFPYAQTAMKYGVGNYILKPINKMELNQTLQKLKEKIEERNISESGIQQLIDNTKIVNSRIKDSLLNRILEQETMNLSLDVLNSEYGFDIKDEVFGIFCIKLDYNCDDLSQSALNIVYGKINDIINANLKPICVDIILSIKESMCYALLIFDKGKYSDVRRVARDCLNQLIIQKSILGSIEFTMALSGVVKEPDELRAALQKTEVYIKDRIATSTERLIESVPTEVHTRDTAIIEKYIRMMVPVIEARNKEGSVEVAGMLKENIVSMKNIRGAEILSMVLSAGTLLLLQLNSSNQEEILLNFRKKCELCGSVNRLFDQLIALQNEMIEEFQKKHDNDTLRPIRLAKQYIQHHYNEQITLEEVSDVVGLSVSYFSVLFKKETNQGFAKYLIEVRINEAKSLLRDSNASVATICKMVGYNDLKHFTHTFEKATGLKPSAYRKLYG